VLVAIAAGQSSPAGKLQDVRVCGLAALDRGASECTRDEAARPIRSSQFNCSVHARADRGERFTGRFLYEGQPFRAFGANVGTSQRSIFIYITAGPTPMPGGRWACQLRVGRERVVKTFRSGGPTGPILNVAVCRSASTVAAGPSRVCLRDESAAPLPATAPVTCSAVFVGGRGKVAGFAFLHMGRDVGLSGTFTLPLPVTAAAPALTPDPRLEPGRWACRFTVAGRQLALKPFRIA
jgi:hypothetical protein